jgi:uncharacterized membrane protein
MFRLVLSLPEAVQDCIQRKCVHVCVILLNFYRPQFYRDYYIRNLQIRQLLSKRQLIMIACHLYSPISRCVSYGLLCIINYNHLAVTQTKEGTTHTRYPFIYISVWWFQHTLIHMVHNYEEHNKSDKPSWLTYVSIKLLYVWWPMIIINVMKLRSQTFGKECLAPSGNRTTIPR